MKRITILVDGMADYPIEELGGLTPLEKADIPVIHDLASKGEVGLVDTIPTGMSPGSDIANLSVMGYDPKIYHKGRSPLEAASMGVDMTDSDVSFRCNLVTLTSEDEYTDKTIIDHSAGDISTEEAAALIEYLKVHLESEDLKYFPGVSYRHLILWKNGPYDFDLTPPHDILGKKVKDFMPKGPYGDYISGMMKKSFDLLKNHPINLARVENGLNPANSIWIWGEGKKPTLDSFHEKFGVKGAVISAVDLIQGIGVLAGLDVIKVEGATGTLHTNFDGKAAAAIKGLSEGYDFIYLHLEAPDECGHQGDLEGKIKSIELIDQKVVSPIFNYLLKTDDDFKIMILPDHATPIALRTHTSDPVPYLIFDSTEKTFDPDRKFTEKCGKESGIIYDTGVSLSLYFFDK
ncbi:cofactor-independent phosphoglycerate mutase [Alkalibacter mobilis]|uniref:cofactor-independent phosphoglycerate mutase n=1 Tax=Alkalibacter mobilis TaxID=2787712 RepID=UPI00189D3899|nr:cofactor-independent phosphoglycerate mutase [Alkalibacter mobilis]MBF7097070.1 cofactor-independent phosphoglycerate mutase [Alkalibacter mobilis]